MRLAIGNVANTGCYTRVQLNAERLSTFLCMIQLHFMLHFRHGISEIHNCPPPSRIQPHRTDRVPVYRIQTGYSRFRTSYMMTSYQSNRDENHSMAWHHSQTLPGQCMSYRSLQVSHFLSSRVVLL